MFRKAFNSSFNRTDVAVANSEELIAECSNLKVMLGVLEKELRKRGINDYCYITGTHQTSEETHHPR